MAKKQIRLSEEKLRNFISYSVAKLLKEGNGFNGFAGRPIYDSHGEYDGGEGSNYGSSDVEVPFYEWAENTSYKRINNPNLKYGYEYSFNQNGPLALLFNSVNKEHGGQFTEILKSENDYFDLLSTIYENIGNEDITLCVDFTYSEGMEGDGYMQPDDDDELTIDKSYLKQPETNQALQKIDPMYREFMTAVASEWADGWVDEDYIYDNYIENTLTEARNLGITAHFDGNSPFQPEKPYENMTWDEYCEAKRKEREGEEEKNMLHDTDYPKEKENRGNKIHFDGKKREETPEDKERAEHMFDDKYWVNKMNLTKEDLAEMVNKSVRLIAERINLNEISKGLLDRAREAAHKDMMQNFGDYKTRQKRERQWNKFTDEYGRLDSEERDSICPHVDEADLVNMPEDTYVVMNGDGRDAVNANFRTSYSGRAGTKEQCEEYVKRFYDKGTNWEYLPEIVPLEEYLNSKHRR